MRTAALTLGFGGLYRFAGSYPAAAASLAPGYGPLSPDPGGILDLSPGFSYRVLSRTGDPMQDGFQVPGAPDGMATFAANGKTILIRNHELTTAPPEEGPFGADNHLLSRLGPEQFYDRGRGIAPCLGGTSTLVLDSVTGQVERQYLSLAGTVRNCAGGATPWGSWITCEETVQAAEDNFERHHGYNFEIPATVQPAVAPPLPLKQMGRFNHEAIAVDPASGIVYQTEDRGDGLLYRYIPKQPAKLAAGGRLQALVVRDQKSLDTRNWNEDLVTPGHSMAVEWIDITDVEAPKDDLRFQGFAAGAALFTRGEGMWYGNKTIYFACTDGGKARKGQIWQYTPSTAEGTPQEQASPGKLELFIEPNHSVLVDNADNLTVAPWGDLIICEDGPEAQYLVGVTPAGQIYKFGHNVLNNSEFAGAVFSPDGTTLFVNIQRPGLTLAITGPWQQG